jgi:hypothetical protein
MCMQAMRAIDSGPLSRSLGLSVNLTRQPETRFFLISNYRCFGAQLAFSVPFLPLSSSTIAPPSLRSHYLRTSSLLPVTRCPTFDLLNIIMLSLPGIFQFSDNVSKTPHRLTRPPLWYYVFQVTLSSARLGLFSSASAQEAVEGDPRIFNIPSSVTDGCTRDPPLSPFVPCSSSSGKFTSSRFKILSVALRTVASFLSHTIPP